MLAGKSLPKIEAAVARGDVSQSARQNLETFLRASRFETDLAAVEELIKAGAWPELNDRFYKQLAFGTGGIRGRTIGKIVTAAERGNSAATDPPEFPCVGTNAMNFFNVRRATLGLTDYVKEWRAVAGSTNSRPTIVIAYDTRHFSRAFAELAAKTATKNGCNAALFEGPRSTPELSFAVRYLKASAGIVVTASHNPPHDNGYKVYFDDGAQVIEPHASGIIARVDAISGGTGPVPSHEPGDATAAGQGEIKSLGNEIDDAYMARLETLILDPELVRRAKSLRIVFTPIHGTGGVIIKPMLQRLGFNVRVVEDQDRFDGNFPTVKSPNPENAEALRLGIELAGKEDADLVVATDPDCDRMGVAVRGDSGEMVLLTGNQIGSLMAWHRAKTLFEHGILTRENAARGVIIKTFVTTDLQKAIAEHYGLRCVETLTGFKYIGAKLEKYERALKVDDRLRAADAATRRSYREMSEEETRRLRLEHSSYYVFGGEESYGYSGADFVRDKDGNGATIMFCEVAAYAKSRHLSLAALLDEIYATLGYYMEKNGSLTFDGAEGATKITRLLESYLSHPPSEMIGVAVASVRNFATEKIRDVEGDEIPREKMLIFSLADHTRIAVRGSGTEPKIKYYMFAQRRPEGSAYTADQLGEIKKEIGERIEQLWAWLQEDAQARLGLQSAG